MIENIIRMQELTYELEALLNLAATHEERVNTLIPLIRNKIAALEVLLPDNTEEEGEVRGTLGEVRGTGYEGRGTGDEGRGTGDEVGGTMEETEERVERTSSISKSTEPRNIKLTINDRFYYARELFGGNLRDLDQAIGDLASLDSYEEVEDYLYNDWGLDPENPATADLLLILSRSFN